LFSNRIETSLEIRALRQRVRGSQAKPAAAQYRSAGPAVLEHSEPELVALADAPLIVKPKRWSDGIALDFAYLTLEIPVARWTTQDQLALQVLIRKTATENPSWGAPRIHGEVQKLRFEVSERTVADSCSGCDDAASPGAVGVPFGKQSPGNRSLRLLHGRVVPYTPSPVVNAGARLLRKAPRSA
jgi:hypothetical protein